MSIIRSPRKERNFTIIDNAVLQHPKLSVKALGMLVRLLSRPDNWKTNSETLAREFSCGRDQIRNILAELESYGFMTLNKFQDVKGQWKAEWTVHETPTDLTQNYSLPSSGQPEPGFPHYGLSGLIQRTDLQRTDTNCLVQERNAVYQKDDVFDIFWKAYPRKTNKGFARKVFQKLKVNDALLKKMLSAIAQQEKSEQWKNPQYIPHPSSWLNGERWEDEITTPTSFNPFAGGI